jgi:biotin transport system permease protein
MRGSGGYEGGNSCVYRLDPRSKIIGAAALSIVGLRSGISFLLFATLASLAVAACARLTPRRLWEASRPALPFIVIVFLLHAFSAKEVSSPAYGFGAVRMTAEGLFEGGLLAWRFSLLLLAGFLLTMTTLPAHLTSGIEKLLRPVKVVGISSQDLALMVSLALRFIPTLQDEMETLKAAEMARGANFTTGGILTRVRALSGLALPLSLAVFRRCDQLVEAMHARAYDGGPRTDLRHLTLTVRDWLVIALSAAAAAASFTL